jgi:hypothetical protein
VITLSRAPSFVAQLVNCSVWRGWRGWYKQVPAEPLQLWHLDLLPLPRFAREAIMEAMVSASAGERGHKTPLER